MSSIRMFELKPQSSSRLINYKGLNYEAVSFSDYTFDIVKELNFVEVKNSTFGTHSNAKHLAYLGDADIGDNVNIGAGTITCNYDGVKKIVPSLKMMHLLVAIIH